MLQGVCRMRDEEEGPGQDGPKNAQLEMWPPLGDERLLEGLGGECWVVLCFRKVSVWRRDA